MILSGLLFWITSITMHKFIMKYPQIKDICEHSACYCSFSYIVLMIQL